MTIDPRPDVAQDLQQFMDLRVNGRQLAWDNTLKASIVSLTAADLSAAAQAITVSATGQGTATGASQSPGDTLTYQADTGVDLTLAKVGNVVTLKVAGQDTASGSSVLAGGTFDLDIRDSTSTALEGVAYGWYQNFGGTSAPTCTQTLTALAPGDIPEAPHITRSVRLNATAGGSIDAFCLYRQTIGNQDAGQFAAWDKLGWVRGEGSRTLSGRPVVFSFWAKATTAGKFMSVELGQQFGQGGSSPQFTLIGGAKIALQTAWTRHVVTGTVASVVGKTIGVGDSLEVTMWLGGGSSFDSRTGTLGNQAIDVQIADVRLEPGPRPSPTAYKRSVEVDSLMLHGQRQGDNLLINSGGEVLRDPNVTSVSTTGINRVLVGWSGVRSGSVNGATWSRGTAIEGSGRPRYLLRTQRNNADSQTASITTSMHPGTPVTSSVSGGVIVVSFDVSSQALTGTLTVQIQGGTGVDQNSANGFTGSTNLRTVTIPTDVAHRRHVACFVPTSVTEIAVNWAWTPSGTAGATEYFDLQAPKLEVGAWPTAYEPEPPEAALRRCRYLYRRYQRSSGEIIPALKTSASVVQLHLDGDEMRTTPAITHSLTDGSYVAVAPSAAQWTLVEAGNANATKTGTVALTGQALSPKFSEVVLNTATWSVSPNYALLGSSMHITLDAEI